MKKSLLLIFTVCVALVSDFFFAQLGGTMFPPLTFIVVCYWFWWFSLTKRIILALVIGFLLEIIGFLPMGVHTLILICAAYACEQIKSFFSNTESRTVIAFNLIILIIIVRVLVIPLSFFVEFF